MNIVENETRAKIPTRSLNTLTVQKIANPTMLNSLKAIVDSKLPTLQNTIHLMYPFCANFALYKYGHPRQVVSICIWKY